MKAKKSRPLHHLELIAMAKKFKILSLGPLVSCVESLSAIKSVREDSREVFSAFKFGKGRI